jgi:hypothetical protein
MGLECKLDGRADIKTESSSHAVAEKSMST